MKAWNPDGDYIATIDYHGGLKFWDATTHVEHYHEGLRISPLQGMVGCRSTCNRIAWSPDSRSIVTVNDKNRSSIYELFSGNCSAVDVLFTHIGTNPLSPCVQASIGVTMYVNRGDNETVHHPLSNYVVRY
jgi:WD40 repeat protein